VLKGEISIEVDSDEFKYYWKKISEHTSSSMSGLHFGHYKAAATSDYLSKFHAMKLSIISRTGHAPDRWSHGLTVMLEKVAGVALVNKLRAILLMEADFNFHNKLIFGSRMINAARKDGEIPDEQYCEKQKVSEDGIFQGVLCNDVSRQSKLPSTVTSVDASNCYDRIAHAFMSLVYRAFGVPMGAVVAMLSAIQCMRLKLSSRRASGPARCA